MFAFVLLFVKHLLVKLHSTPPTDAQMAAFDAYEDETGNYGQYPSPAERHEDALEWRAEMCEESLWTLLRWRLAVAWMPFCKGREQRLIGEWASRKLFPDLYGLRRKRAKLRKKVNV